MRDIPPVMESDLPLVGAIEGGGTKFICAIGHSPSKVLDRVTIPTGDPVSTLAACARFFDEMAQRHGRIEALGVACFGPLQLQRGSPDYGCLLSTPKPGWSLVNVVSLLESALHLPVVLDTDVGSAATAEWRQGSGRGLNSLAYVTVGTGIGGAVAPTAPIKQRLSHPEMGHVPVRRDPLDSSFTGLCPFHGDCLEGLACGPAIRARWGCDLSSLPHDHPGRAIIAGYVGQLMASIALLHAVDRIAIGGGVMADGSLLPLVRRAAHAYLNGYVQSLRDLNQVDTYITVPAFGSDAAIAGAMMQAQDLLTA